MSQDFTVYYVVGQPRSGSTFVGDRLARSQGLVNAGEVWQTFRSVGLVQEPGFDSGRGRWARPKNRQEKNMAIAADPFWSQVLQAEQDGDALGDPYKALIEQAKKRTNGLVDCSKGDWGIAEYERLGCRVHVVHSVRAFTSWSTSMIKYQKQFSLPVRSRLRLLLAYLRVNRRLKRTWQNHNLRQIPQEQLQDIDMLLGLHKAPKQTDCGYLRAEMFGTPGFTGQFDPSRGTQRVTRFDRLCYRALGLQTKI